MDIRVSTLNASSFAMGHSLKFESLVIQRKTYLKFDKYLWAGSTC